MEFYLPFWEDRLDPNFDFINDQYSALRTKPYYKYDKCVHQIFPTPPYEGILFSLHNFKSKISLVSENESLAIKEETSIKDYLDVNKVDNIKIMGDCGAFGYVSEDTPPKPFFSVENVSNIYHSLDFDYGVSVDHLVVKYIFKTNKETGEKFKHILTLDEMKFRIELTLQNAKKFLKIKNEKDYLFTPIGVAQGYDVDSYRYSVEKLVEMGYDYIGIGGLVQYNSDVIVDILKGISDYSTNVNIHLFGVLRPDRLKKFKELGVNSFDSASYFRKAWLRANQNYLGTNGEWYGAIRVPISNDSRVRKNADINGISEETLRIMEKKALDLLIRYDENQAKVEDVLDAVISYDELLLRDYDNHKLREIYKKTLEDRPWDKCDCVFCQEAGIHTLIFRRANRNKRRGFHNIWRFKQDFMS